MTYGQIEQKVRTLVNDTQTPYRFSQETIFDFTREAVKHLRNIQPTEKYGPDSRLDEPVPEADADTDIRINEEKYVEAVVKYAAHKVYELDQTDTVNLQISETLRTRAEALMQL